MLLIDSLKLFQGILALAFVEVLPCIEVEGRWIFDNSGLLKELFAKINNATLEARYLNLTCSSIIKEEGACSTKIPDSLSPRDIAGKNARRVG